jgi:hypothetical protein
LRKRKKSKKIEKCGNCSKEKKTGRNSTYSELESVLFSWYKQARATNIPVDGNVLREEAKKIAAQLNIENFTASNGWITRFKDRHGLVYKKLAEESAAVDSESMEVWLERLPSLLEGYEPRDIYNADETGLFLNVLPDRTLALTRVLRGWKKLKRQTYCFSVC